jgi:hypothetical protein
MESVHPLVIVTPVYEDLEASTRLFREFNSVLGREVFVVAVDDGSVRQPLGPDGIVAAGLDGVVLKLKRNVGHQRAIAVGLGYVADRLRGVEHIVVMDSDGEDTPFSIKELIGELERPDVDVVVAERRSRVETFRFRMFYVFYKFLFGLLTGCRINFGNFMALKPRALKRLISMQELWIHVAACVLTSRLRIATCALDRGPRYAGRSRMNFVGLVLHGFKGVMVFAEDVLVRVGIGCALLAAFSVVSVVVAITLKLFEFATPGWFSIALGILLLVFLQTGALTLMTLMLTGVVRGGGVATLSYKEFLDTVLYASSSRSV